MKNFIFALFAFSLALTACKKEVVSTPKPSKPLATKTLPSDAFLGNRVKTMMLGLLDLSKNGDFTTLVNTEVAKQFDDDDNVLLSTLVDVCSNASIDLINEMDQSISSYDNSLPSTEHSYDNYQNLTGQSNIEDIIAGFEWEGNHYHLQVYIPFVDQVNLLDTPVICFGHQEVETTIGYKINSDNSISVVVVDEDYAEQHLVWIVSVNESVNENGVLEKPIDMGTQIITNEYAKSLGRSVRVTAVKIDDTKESWIKGKAEVALAAGVLYSYCGWKKIQSVEMLVKIGKNDLNKWCTITHGSASAVIFADYPSTPLLDTDRVAITMFEKDASGSRTYTPCSGIVPINYKTQNAEYLTNILNASRFPNTAPNISYIQHTVSTLGIEFVGRIWN